MGDKENPLPIFIWDAADPLRLRLATRKVRDAEDAYHHYPALPIAGLMAVMGVPPETLAPREGELLVAYMARLFPTFLEVLEDVWGPLNTRTAADALRLAMERSAREAAELEIPPGEWFEGTRH